MSDWWVEGGKIFPVSETRPFFLLKLLNFVCFFSCFLISMREACQVKDALGVVEHIQTAEAVNQTQQGIKTRKEESHLLFAHSVNFSPRSSTHLNVNFSLCKKRHRTGPQEVNASGAKAATR